MTDRKLYLNRVRYSAPCRDGVTSAAARPTESVSRRPPPAQGRSSQCAPILRTERLTPWDAITSYNNFYEFAGSDDKDLPSQLAPENLITKPWTITVEGECAKAGKYSFEQALDGQTLEERIYRHRCVEGWSMVIPWVGFPLSDFIKKCQPTPKAKYVAFESYYDARRMPRSLRLPFDWPYIEGLRMTGRRTRWPYWPSASTASLSSQTARYPSCRGNTASEHQVDRPNQLRREQPLGTYEKVDPDRMASMRT